MEKSEQWLKEAAQSTKGAELAVAITQIQVLMSRGQLEQALAVVIRLRKQNPKHKHLLKMHIKVLRELEDWIGLKELLPTVRKLGKLPQDKLKELLSLYEKGQFKEAVKLADKFILEYLNYCHAPMP